MPLQTWMVIISLVYFVSLWKLMFNKTNYVKVSERKSSILHFRSPGPGVFHDLFFLFGLVEFFTNPGLCSWPFEIEMLEVVRVSRIVILNRDCTFVPTLKRLL